MSNGIMALAVMGLVAALHVAVSRSAPATRPAGSRPAKSRPARSRFVVLADTHIDRKQGYRFGRTKPNPGFARAIEQINTLKPTPSEAIIVGDLARVGREDDYRKYLEMLSVLKVRPVHHLLGNHDRYVPFRKVVLKNKAGQNPAKHEFPRYYTAWDFNPTWRFVSLDTRWKRSSGRLTAEQIKWFEAQAKAAKGRNVLVFMHNDPTRRGLLGISDTKEFLAAVDRHRNVRAIVYGHRHEMEFRTHGAGVHVIGAPPTSWVFKPRRPRGWLLMTPASKSLTVEYVPLHDKQRVKAFTKKLTWQ